MALSNEQVIKNKEIIEKLIETFEGEGRVEKVKKMMHGKVGHEYYLCPGSQKEQYHACYPGGLAEHSLNVVRSLRQLAGLWAKDKYSVGTLNFVGLFHDLGKVGDGVEPYYLPHPSEWHRKQGTLYEINKECVYMPTSERGLYILQRHGIELSSDEWLAIRLNDGMYDETNRRYGMHEPELALLVHMADRWATELEKASE